MAVIVSIVGASNSGKTTLIEKLVPQIQSRGYRVGTIKHDVHGFEMDHPGKDTWRHRKAGATTVLISGPDQVAMIKKIEEEIDLDILAGRFIDEDLILTEGFKGALKPKIEVFRRELLPEPLCGEKDNLIAMVTSDNVDVGVPVFQPENVSGLADFIVERYLESRKRFNMVTRLDGKKLPMKYFVQEFVIGGILGMLSSLRGFKRPRRIEILINLNDE